jgi:hypothetical protein
MSRRRSSRLPVIAFAALASGCGQRIDVGSDLLWTARFESGNFDEWTGVAGGGTSTSSSGDELVASSEQVYRGSFAAKMTIATSSAPVAALSTLVREGNLPDEGYYSAWFYLPQSAAIPDAPILQYWAVMRFRARTVAADPSSIRDLYDIDLRSLASGEMTLQVFDYDLFADAAMVERDPLVPAGRWFQVEAFYRNAPDVTGQLAVWLDGRLVADIAKATGTPGWVGWRVGNMGLDTRPQTVTVYVDDCALSRVRVGPAGLLAM